MNRRRRTTPIILKTLGVGRFDHRAKWPPKVRNVSRLGSHTNQITSRQDSAVLIQVAETACVHAREGTSLTATPACAATAARVDAPGR
jgi:hypothetical protein